MHLLKTFVCCIFMVSSISAYSGQFFEITGSGQPATLDLVLCLNAEGPLTCQNYTATRQTLRIRTIIPNHTYPKAGIRLNTPGYSLSGCRLISNGYCLFPVSDTSSAEVTATSNEIPPALTSVTPDSGPAAGGTGVTLNGTNLTGTTSVTFDGLAATNVNVVNATTITAVTPAHAAGAVDVIATTPSGAATLSNGYTYLANAIGQSSGGGVIACLNGGLNNLIAATTDNSTSIEWGGVGTAVGAAAQSNTDGASNTAAIVAALGNNGGTPYAAQLCNNYEIDSQGNIPCEAGNACYNDWFLPAGNNAGATGQLNCLYTNRVAIGGFNGLAYWSSTEDFGAPTLGAFLQTFPGGGEFGEIKDNTLSARCVRAFTP